MHESEKSDSPIVPLKPANKARRLAAEPVEGRGGVVGNAGLQSTVRTQSRAAVSQAQARIREAIARNQKEKLTALLHHITVDVLRAVFFALKRRAAPGIDAVTWDMYEETREENLRELHRRVHAGVYRALPSRRTYIPKADGRKRPLGIAALEDKIVQAAVVMILTPIYEAEFLGFSYGFRPGRSQHDALDALVFGIKGRSIRWILDADIRSFFDTISHSWLVRFLEHRIGDRRIIRLIQKWLTAGVLDKGLHIETEEGTLQGAVISPLLANIYLHYVYDLWVQAWRQRHATSDMIVVRYADDTIVGFQRQGDATTFLNDLKARLAKFALDLHPDKTRLIAFGKFIAEERRARGKGRPETFDFLGFTHICGVKRTKDGKSRNSFQILRRTRRKRKWATIRAIKMELRRIRHDPLDEQGRRLARMLEGHYAYFAVPTNIDAVRAVRHHVKVRWYLSLLRRSQKRRLSWRRMNVIAEKHLPQPTIVHPWPEQRFVVKHRRQEPDA
jgi:RNA-directed DNA polymerase